MLFAFILLFSVLASCDVQLYNHCEQGIYRWTQGPAGILTSGLIQPNSVYTEPYYNYPWNGTGISIKLGKWYPPNGQPDGAITQLEYSFTNTSIDYDVTCLSGDQRCYAAFNLPDDNWANNECDYKYQNLILHMCQSGGSC